MSEAWQGLQRRVADDALLVEQSGMIALLTGERDQIKAERDRLYGAIVEHHGQRADDRCVEDDDRLYEAAGLPPCDRRVGDPEAMLEHCKAFIRNRCQGGGPWKSYAELEAEVAALRAACLKTYCAYCGAEFPVDDPADTSDIGRHIRTCHRHPMRDVEAEVARLRETLDMVARERDGLKASMGDVVGFLAWTSVSDALPPTDQTEYGRPTSGLILAVVVGQVVPACWRPEAPYQTRDGERSFPAHWSVYDFGDRIWRTAEDVRAWAPWLEGPKENDR